VAAARTRREESDAAYAAERYDMMEKRYENDEITAEEWEYFQENGELPPKP